jgi:hypothetical protein
MRNITMPSGSWIALMYINQRIPFRGTMLLPGVKALGSVVGVTFMAHPC